MTIKEFNAQKLPGEPGVYIFKQKNSVLYVGKATSLKSRVRSYFLPNLADTRGQRIVNMVEGANKIDFIKTDSVLEALILEANLIKKLQPPYNTLAKDDTSFNMVVITKEKYPEVKIVRERELISSRGESSGESGGLSSATTFGPFTNGRQLKEALQIIRKIFPFAMHNNKKYLRGCFDYQIGLCPGTCINAISKQDYARTIRHLVLFLSGKKESLLKSLEKEMKAASKNLEFEKAEKIKRQVFALKHIQDVSLLKQDSSQSRRSHAELQAFAVANEERSSVARPSGSPPTTHYPLHSEFRIEAYDIAHLSGGNTVGVMTVVNNGEADKSQYRKFRIKNKAGADDVANLREVLSRRLEHHEWPMPKLIVIDGGTAQRNIAEKILKDFGIMILIVGVVKDEKHNPKKVLGDSAIIQKYKKEILLANAESHRFALSYHRHLRNKGFLE